MNAKINALARRLAIYHAAAPEVIAAGGCSAADVDGFERDGLLIELREAGLLVAGDLDQEREALEDLREALRNRLADLQGIGADEARSLVARAASAAAAAAATIPDFTFKWLDESQTRLSVRYTGEVPAVVAPDGQLVEDPGLVAWPTDSEISAAVGVEVVFKDAGDDLLEGIFAQASASAAAASADEARPPVARL